MHRQTILVTGASGFIGKNVVKQISDKFPELNFIELNSSTSDDDLNIAVRDCDLVFHFAGANRPSDDNYLTANEEFTSKLCRLCELHGGKEIIFSSSTHAKTETLYGVSKKNCEQILIDYRNLSGSRVQILRLPGVFGKWSKPNYNSVIATFCHRISRDEEIHVNDEDTVLPVLYIDDLVEALVLYLSGASNEINIDQQIRRVRLKDLVDILMAFRTGPHTCFDNIDGLGVDKKLIKDLHSTYVSFIPDEALIVPLNENKDPRGVFCEVMRQMPFGQLSFASIASGATRGGHYHHSKVEIFVVVHGEITFEQTNLLTGENTKYFLSSQSSASIYTKPGCVHSLHNSTNDPAVVLIWTNEKFDQVNHDTYFMKEK